MLPWAHFSLLFNKVILLKIKLENNIWLRILQFFPITCRVKAKPLQWPKWAFKILVPCFLSYPIPSYFSFRDLEFVFLLLGLSALNSLPYLFKYHFFFCKSLHWSPDLKLKRKLRKPYLSIHLFSFVLFPIPRIVSIWHTIYIH